MATQFRINGKKFALSGVSLETPLLYVLRNDLALNGAKYGCGLGQCGACKVIVGGHGVPSCLVPLSAVEGQEVQTLERLGTPEALHPIQQAFLAEQAAQCGYCTAGMIMGAKALLDQKARPTEAQIREGLDGHLCRCGTYQRIIRAVLRAASEMER